MTPALRRHGWAWLLLGTALAVAAWRIVAHTAADALAGTDPARALEWVDGHPAALLALAERQLAAGRTAQASATARTLLQRAPLEGRAWRILAQAEAAAGRTNAARDLYRRTIAAMPHDIASRAWLLRDHLAHQRHAEALAEIDRILRISPPLAKRLVPVLAQMAADPDFATALAGLLASNPPWRAPLLREIQGGRHPAAEQVFTLLQQDGGLTPGEQQARVEALIRQQRWGEAYAHWVSALPPGQELPLVFNGDFADPVTGAGFDWRIARLPGVTVSIRADARAGRGQVAHIRFNHRPAPHAGLEQALLLAPGRYRFQAMMRAEQLRSEGGLEWELQCAQGGHGPLGTSQRLAGTFDWTTVTWDVEVPESCPGQWLRLRNPAPAGIARYVSGQAWITAVAATAIPGQ